MVKTEIIFDTSFLKIKNIVNYSDFKFCNNYYNFIDFLGANDLLECYQICIPEIVIEELKKQYIDSYINTVNNYNSMCACLRGIYDVKNIEYINYEKLLTKKIVDYIKVENVIILPIPKGSKKFKKIINRAIDKKKPFCGENGESDKGFKDVLQWESLISHAINSGAEKFILFTKNKKDFDRSLQREFFDDTNKKIDFFYEMEELQGEILIENQVEANYDVINAIILSEIDNGKLTDKTNVIIEPYYNMVMDKVISFSNLTDLSNCYYTFDITALCNSQEEKFTINCHVKNNSDIIIDEAIIWA